MTSTKIIATVGPSCQSHDVLLNMIRAGTSVFRFNLKHNTQEWHKSVFSSIVALSDIAHTPVATLLDVPGIEHMEDFLPMLTLEKVDYIALSYIHAVDDIALLKRKMTEKQVHARIIAKIETTQALRQYEDLIRTTDGVMIARGDLGQEVPYEQVPFYQKHIIKRALEIGKPVITATQMLESMIGSDIPTRAEVSDVANALYDSTDAVMLSAETAIGRHPVEAVAVMKRVIDYIDGKRPVPPYAYETVNQTQALTSAACDLARFKLRETIDIKAFVVITETGETAQALARLRPSQPVIAISRHESIVRQLLLVWGGTTGSIYTGGSGTGSRNW